MKLAEIPQIVILLEQERVIDAAQKAAILERLNNAAAEGKKAFAGEVGIELKFYDKATLDAVLLKQTMLKAEAAVEDIQTIAKHGTQAAPGWLKANWGNNDVNPASANPTKADGVSAAANIAQNIVMIANAHPTIAEGLKEAVSAAANLARGITNGSSERVPLATKKQEWMKSAEEGLRMAVEKTGYQPKDAKDKPIDLGKFIAERFKEIGRAVELALVPAEQKAGLSV